MSVLSDTGPGDKELQRYLLGLLPDEDAERLDELSIADDQIASRLQVVEDELVDAFVNGELSGEMLDRFESFYLASERRRQKVNFARTLLAAGRTARPAPVRARRSVGSHSAEPAKASAESPLHGPLVHRSRAVWKLAAAASVLLAAGGLLLYEDAGVRNDLREAQRASAELSRRALELETQLNDQRSTRTESVQEAVAAPRALPTMALVLLPQMRSSGPIATLAVPSGLDRIALDLRIDPNDFERYQVALKDPGPDRIIWRSESIAVRTVDNVPTVSIVIPANILKAQHYSLELNGLAPARSAEVVGGYAFEVVRR